jgi:hypothetical protein
MRAAAKIHCCGALFCRFEKGETKKQVKVWFVQQPDLSDLAP